MPDTAHTTDSSDSEIRALRVPPHSIEAEQAVLGGVFLDQEAWVKVVERVTEADFYRRDKILEWLIANRKGINFGRDVILPELARLLVTDIQASMNV